MASDCCASDPVREELPLSQLLGALSYALDLTEGQPAGHCVRASWIGVNVGRALGLDDAALVDLHHAILLKDLGCSSNAARIAELYLTDDLAFKERAKFLNGQTGPALRFILGQTGSGADLISRLRATCRVARDADAIVQDLIQTRCDRGAAIARQLRLDGRIVDGIRALDERWDGSGRPDGLRGHAIPLFARIALLSQVADVFATAAGPQAACDEVQARSGAWFDPEIVSAFLDAASGPAFWETLSAPDVGGLVLRLVPDDRRIDADDGYFDDIATAFAQVVDAKSPYTHGHSVRVAEYSGIIARALGFDDAAARRLRRAALLHDVGKLGVSNVILDKPGKLADEDWRSVRMHPVHSRRILGRIAGFGELAEIGGAHHERLDGKGYPRGAGAEEIGLATRIVTAADVCDALTAERPYRAAMSVEQMLGILQKDVGTAFDAACVDALRGAARSPDFVVPAAAAHEAGRRLQPLERAGGLGLPPSSPPAREALVRG